MVLSGRSHFSSLCAEVRFMHFIQVIHKVISLGKCRFGLEYVFNFDVQVFLDPLVLVTDA